MDNSFLVAATNSDVSAIKVEDLPDIDPQDFGLIDDQDTFPRLSTQERQEQLSFTSRPRRRQRHPQQTQI